METTVTMSLDRYKELEAYEQVVFNLKHNNKDFIFYRGGMGEYLVERSNEANAQLVYSLNEAVRGRDNAYERIGNYEKRTGKKVE